MQKPFTIAELTRGVREQLGPPALDAAFALVDSTCGAPRPLDDVLVTPTLDTRAMERVWLHFASETWADAGGSADVLLSLDGGLTFVPEPIFSYAGGGASSPPRTRSSIAR